MKNILLAEDGEDDIFFMKLALKRCNLPVSLQIVTNGDLAIDYLNGIGRYANRQFHPLPELVCLDVKLPRRNGIEVLTWIRAQTQFKELSVVMLSTSNVKTDMDSAYQAGANDYHVKPGGMVGLQGLVAGVIQQWLNLPITQD